MRVTLCVLAILLAVPTLAQEEFTTGVHFYNWRAARGPAFASGILVDPTNDEIWYVSSPEGLFITRNGGDSWLRALAGEVAPEAFVIDPINANRLYAVVDQVLFTSTNKGVSWVETYRFPQQIVSLALSFRDGTLYAGPRYPEGPQGLYRSADRGVTFVLLPFGSAASRSSVIDIDVDSAGCIYAAAESGGAGIGALLQTCDGGASWSNILGSLRTLPSKVMWNARDGFLYISGPTLGLYATANKGGFWRSYTFDPVAAFALPGRRLFYSSLESSGPGVYTNYKLDSLSEGVQMPFFTGFRGDLTMFALNSAQTKIFATSPTGLVWTGDVEKPSITSRAVYVRAGSTLVLTCEFCYFETSPDLEAFSRTIKASSWGSMSFFPMRFSTPGDIAPGVYSARMVSRPTWDLPFDLVVGDPAPRISQITSARFGQKTAFARGEIVSVFGVNFNGGLDQSVSRTNVSRYVPWETDVAQSRISIDGQVVPMQFSMTNRNLASQINFQIPPGLTEGTHNLRVHRLDNLGNINATTNPFSFNVRSTSPTYLGNDGIPLFVQNITQNPAGNVFVTGSSPAFPGDIAILFATGLGGTSPPVPLADVPPPGTTANVLLPITALVRAGSSEWKVDVLGAAASPQFPGLYQIAIRFPLDARPVGGTVDLVLSAGDNIQTFRLNFSTRN
jgi:uncharacterized protein (TIGR03437 family)